MSNVSPQSLSSTDARHPTDDELLSHLRQGNVQAYEAIFRHYVPPLCEFAFRYLRSQEEAEDVVQVVLTKLWDDRTTVAIRGSLAQFLYVAVRNRCKDRLKHEAVERRWREREVGVGDMSAVDAFEEPDAIFEVAERHAAIVRTLSELPERRRAVCTLRWVDGLSYAQIGQRLGISEKTVKNQIARAVEHVRWRLHELLG